MIFSFNYFYIVFLEFFIKNKNNTFKIKFIVKFVKKVALIENNLLNLSIFIFIFNGLLFI